MNEKMPQIDGRTMEKLREDDDDIEVE